MNSTEQRELDSVDRGVGRDSWRRLAAILGGVALWGLLTPYVGQWVGIELNAGRMVEVVDHVVPGVVAVALTGHAFWAGRMHLVVALSVVLAGFWMTATHVPLLKQAVDSQVAWSWAIWHSTPGLLLLIMSAAAAYLAFNEAENS